MLLDEMTQGLAPNIATDLGRTLRRVADEGRGVLLVEQNGQMALEVADRVYVVDQGVIVHSGDARELRADPAWMAEYLQVWSLAEGAAAWLSSASPCSRSSRLARRSSCRWVEARRSRAISACYTTESLTDTLWIDLAILLGTSRIRVGSYVTISYLRHPIIAAQMATTAADVSGGRFVLGVGLGHRVRLAALGVRVGDAVGRPAGVRPGREGGARRARATTVSRPAPAELPGGDAGLPHAGAPGAGLHRRRGTDDGRGRRHRLRRGHGVAGAAGRDRRAARGGGPRGGADRPRLRLRSRSRCTPSSATTSTRRARPPDRRSATGSGCPRTTRPWPALVHEKAAADIAAAFRVGDTATLRAAITERADRRVLPRGAGRALPRGSWRAGTRTGAATVVIVPTRCLSGESYTEGVRRSLCALAPS